MSEELEAILRAQYDGGYDTAQEAQRLQSAIDRLAVDPVENQRVHGIVDAVDVEIQARTAYHTGRGDSPASVTRPTYSAGMRYLPRQLQASGVADGADENGPVLATSARSNLIDVEDDSGAAVRQAEWAAFYQAEMPFLVRYLMKCSGDSDVRDAADAAQSAFAELFAKRSTVRNPRAWLRTVAFRQMLRQNAKSEHPLDVLRQEPAVSAASTRLEMREEEQAVLDLIRHLPLAQRQVLALTMDQFTYREIAEIMNMNEDKVRKKAERARAMMKELLRDTDS